MRSPKAVFHRELYGMGTHICYSPGPWQGLRGVSHEENPKEGLHFRGQLSAAIVHTVVVKTTKIKLRREEYI